MSNININIVFPFSLVVALGNQVRASAGKEADVPAIGEQENSENGGETKEGFKEATKGAKGGGCVFFMPLALLLLVYLCRRRSRAKREAHAFSESP